MKLGSHIVRFDMKGIPVVGNTETGCIVGLTENGAQLCDAMLRDNVPSEAVPEDCRQLTAYLAAQGFFGDMTTKPLHLCSAYLHVSNRCNLSCIGCYSADDARNHVVDPELSDVKRAIDMLSELGIQRLVISGGEPFLRSDLPEITSHAKACGILSVNVLTNGTSCTLSSLAALADTVDVISVSFDGPSADSFAYVRGVQFFECLCEVVRAIQVAGMQARILPTLHSKNIDDVPAYIDLAERLNAALSFSILSGNPDKLGDLMFDEMCLFRLADIMRDASETATRVLDESFEVISSLSAHTKCGAGRTSVSVASDGHVYPCHMLHFPEFSLGDAFTDSTEDIARALDNFSLTSVDELVGCSDCKKRYLCGGGCRARAYDMFGGLNKRDPYCAYYRRAIEKAIDSFVDGCLR